MSVQVENGHVDIALELFEFMGHFRIPGAHRQVFDSIMRKTWGWHKKADRISLSQLMTLTGMKKQSVHRALQHLIEHHLVNRQDDKLSINKNYTEWIAFNYNNDSRKVNRQDDSIQSTARITLVNRQDDTSSTARSTTKETTTKETIQKGGEAEIFLGKFNELRGTKFKTTLSWIDNFTFWLKSYSLEEMIRAVKLARFDPWMDEVITPELLFRTRNKNGSCDYIGTLLNIKIKLSEEDKLLKEGLIA